MQINHMNIEHLYTLPAHVYWKDLQGIYRGSNDYPTESLGINKHIDFIGNNDNDLLQKEAANAIQQNDLAVIAKNTSLRLLENAAFKSELSLDYQALSFKQPLYNHHGKKIVGIMGMSFIVKTADSINPILEKMQLLNMDTNNIFIVIKNYNNHFLQQDVLTLRQTECLYYLILGKTAKEIATILGLSNRTVEHHMVSLKVKYQCTTRSELIEHGLKVKVIRDKLLHEFAD